MLLSSQFPSNYFSISQVEQFFDDFAADFAGARAHACVPNKRTPCAAQPLQAALGSALLQHGRQGVWLGRACRRAAECAGAARAAVHPVWAPAPHPPICVRPPPGPSALPRRSAAAGRAGLLALQPSAGLWVQGRQRGAGAAQDHLLVRAGPAPGRRPAADARLAACGAAAAAGRPARQSAGARPHAAGRRQCQSQQHQTNETSGGGAAALARRAPQRTLPMLTHPRLPHTHDQHPRSPASTYTRAGLTSRLQLPLCVHRLCFIVPRSV